MKHNILIILCIILFLTESILAQETHTINGFAYDNETGEPLFMANVFITNSTMGCATDNNGYFEIKNIPVGKYEIVVSYIGFESEKRFIYLTGNKTDENIFSLSPKTYKLDNVIVEDEDPAEWRRLLKIFTKQLLGSSENSRDCEIINPEVIDLKLDKYDLLIAEANDFIIVNNLALGYKIKVALNKFEFDEETLICNYSYDTLFEELDGDTDDCEMWNLNRISAYNGSFIHFLRSFNQLPLHRHGFYVEETDSLSKISSKLLNKFSNWITNLMDRMSKRADYSLEKLFFEKFYLPKSWIPIFSKGEKDSIFTTMLNTYRKIGYNTRTEQNEEIVRAFLPFLNMLFEKNENQMFRKSNSYYSVILDSTYLNVVYDPSYNKTTTFDIQKWKYKRSQVYKHSWISIPANEYTFAENGSRQGFDNIVLQYGYWGEQRLADLLPVDYFPGDDR